MRETRQPEPTSLTLLAGLNPGLTKDVQRADDKAWIDVIQHMDSIYAELVKSQVKLVEKNAALESARKFTQSVVSSMSDILIVCDVHGMIQQVNEALEKIVGMRSKEMIGKSVDSLFSEQPSSLTACIASQPHHKSIVDWEVELLNARLNAVPMVINSSARYEDKNQCCGFVITGRPLGELRTAYAELRNSHEDLKNTQKQLLLSEKLASLGRLIAGVAHELNNPISFLYANMHAMQRYEKKFSTYLKAVHSNMPLTERENLRVELGVDRMLNDIAPLVQGSIEGAERVSTIVQNLRIFMTPQPQQKKTFDLVALLQRATSWVLAATINSDVKLLTRYPDVLPVENNEGHVHQILINLIQNAIDALQGTPSPQIAISLQQHKQFVEVHLHDNGPGIADDDIDRVFDPFFTTKPEGMGTGLGLYISRGLATEQCDGALLASNHPEGGALIVLRLPGTAAP